MSCPYNTLTPPFNHPAWNDSLKRCQILEGARHVFMELGFDGASMGEIARAAAVSKGTLYVYFTDKGSLFEAIVEQEAREQGKVVFDFDPRRDIELTLRNFGQAYIELLCRPRGGSALRTVMAIAERMPHVGTRFYDQVVAHTIRRLSDYLEAKVRTEQLLIDDCELAAAQFMQLCQATLFQPYIFQAKPAPSKDLIARVVKSGTQMFLVAYGLR
jgi:AcrR family transcriptional regulator